MMYKLLSFVVNPFVVGKYETSVHSNTHVPLSAIVLFFLPGGRGVEAVLNPDR